MAPDMFSTADIPFSRRGLKETEQNNNGDVKQSFHFSFDMRAKIMIKIIFQSKHVFLAKYIA
jgi:hypothetical protein